MLAGADVVAYFSLAPNSKPLMSTGDIFTRYNGYLFYFNTTENQRLFEVRWYK